MPLCRRTQRAGAVGPRMCRPQTPAAVSAEAARFFANLYGPAYLCTRRSLWQGNYCPLASTVLRARCSPDAVVGTTQRWCRSHLMRWRAGNLRETAKAEALECHERQRGQQTGEGTDQAPEEGVRPAARVQHTPAGAQP